MPTSSKEPELSIHSLRARKFPSWIVLAVCLIIFTIKAVTSLVLESSTWDETEYFGLGKYLLQTGRWDLEVSTFHPPLPFYLSSIPLLFVRTDTDLWKYDAHRKQEWVTHAVANSSSGQLLLCSPENRGDRLLIFSRLMMLLPALLLGWCIFSWSRLLYGQWSAMTAIVLYSFCPNILAHARLITPDIPITAFLFIAVYFYWKVLNTGRTVDAVAGGCALGLALLSKYTGLLLIPICITIAVLWSLKSKLLPWRRLVVFGFIGLLILLIGYRMNLEPYFFGIVYQHEQSGPGRWGFLCGNHSNNGWWYYYLLAFFLKTPISAMLLIAGAFVVFLMKKGKNALASTIFLLIPPAIIVFFFSMNPKCIGLRYVLPAYPFLFVFAGSAAPILLSKKILTILFSSLIVWYIGTSIYIHPHYLAYFNEIAGGPDQGYKYFVDSNLDWGQDLKGLGRYMRKHGISKVCLSYFGTDMPDRYGISYDWLPSFILKKPDWQRGMKAVMMHDYIAISATNLQGVYFGKDIFAQFRQVQPVAKIGYSIFIYDFNLLNKN